MANAGDVKATQERLGALEEAVVELKKTKPTEAIESILQTTNDLEAAVTELQQQGPRLDGEAGSMLEAMDRKIESIEHAMAGCDGKVGELERALADLSQQQSGAKAGVAAEPTTAQFAELEKDLRVTKAAVEELSSNVPMSVASLLEKVDDLAGRAVATEETVARSEDAVIELMQRSTADGGRMDERVGVLEAAMAERSAGPGEGDAQTEGLEQAVQNLAAQIAVLQGAQDSCIEVLNEHVTRSDQRFVELSGGGGGGSVGRELEVRLCEVQQEVRQLAEANRLGSELMETLSSSLDGCQKTTEIMQTTLQSTTKQLQAVQAARAGGIAAESIELLQRQVEAIDRRVEQLDAVSSGTADDAKSIDALQARLSSEVEARFELARTVDMLGSRMERAQPASEGADVGGRIQNLTGQLQLVTARLEQHISETQADSGARSSAGELSRLQASVNRLHGDVSQLKNRSAEAISI